MFCKKDAWAEESVKKWKEKTAIFAVPLLIFSIHLDNMKMWLSCTTTMAPRFETEYTTSAICLVILSWTWSMNLKPAPVEINQSLKMRAINAFAVSTAKVINLHYSIDWQGWCSHWALNGRCSSELIARWSVASSSGLSYTLVLLSAKPFSFTSRLHALNLISHWT